jgi:3-oxoacyl-[acyl-carrier-protein] synthase II
MGIITSHGVGKEANWEKISAGKSGIREIVSFDTSGYRCRTGGEATDFAAAPLRNLDSRRLDRASHLLIHAAGEALAEAGLTSDIKNIPLLLSLGTTLGGMLSGEAFHRDVVERGIQRARLSLLSDYLAHAQAINLFREMKLKGDFLIFSNACASGTNAIGHAFNSIRQGKYNAAICGGYDTMSEFTFAGFSSLMAMTGTLCRPFDKDRDGLVLGEGAGILVLEELEHAGRRSARILGELSGYGESTDAHHMTSPDLSGLSAAAALTKALRDASNPAIDYINAHGTGTKYNDDMETMAILIALGEKAIEIPVSSIKPMIGHLLGGAGAVEAIISLLSIIHKTLPPSLNYVTPDPKCSLNIVLRPRASEIRTVLSNSFGFGGSNASLIIKEASCQG